MIAYSTLLRLATLPYALAVALHIVCSSSAWRHPRVVRDHGPPAGDMTRFSCMYFSLFHSLFHFCSSRALPTNNEHLTLPAALAEPAENQQLKRRIEKGGNATASRTEHKTQVTGTSYRQDKRSSASGIQAGFLTSACLSAIFGRREICRVGSAHRWPQESCRNGGE